MSCLCNPIPKPSYKKQKIKKHPPLFKLGYCYRCYMKSGLKRLTGLHRHHLYGGNPDRQWSEIYGLYVDLDYECHELVTDEIDKEFIEHLKQEGQRRFEEQHSREEFMRIFGRNYL